MIELDAINQSVGGEAFPLPWEIRPYQLTKLVGYGAIFGGGVP